MRYVPAPGRMSVSLRSNLCPYLFSRWGFKIKLTNFRSLSLFIYEMYASYILPSKCKKDTFKTLLQDPVIRRYVAVKNWRQQWYNVPTKTIKLCTITYHWFRNLHSYFYTKVWCWGGTWSRLKQPGLRLAIRPLRPQLLLCDWGKLGKDKRVSALLHMLVRSLTLCGKMLPTFSGKGAGNVDL